MNSATMVLFIGGGDLEVECSLELGLVLVLDVSRSDAMLVPV